VFTAVAGIARGDGVLRTLVVSFPFRSMFVPAAPAKSFTFRANPARPGFRL
jgi:hypothetical protein